MTRQRVLQITPQAFVKRTPKGSQWRVHVHGRSQLTRSTVDYTYGPAVVHKIRRRRPVHDDPAMEVILQSDVGFSSSVLFADSDAVVDQVTDHGSFLRIRYGNDPQVCHDYYPLTAEGAADVTG